LPREIKDCLNRDLWDYRIDRIRKTAQEESPKPKASKKRGEKNCGFFSKRKYRGNLFLAILKISVIPIH
jgi:hypothetical protein